MQPGDGPDHVALQVHADALHACIRPLGSAVVALSGGVDSSVVLAAAYRALGHRVLAVTGCSASVPAEEVADAARIAAWVGVPHRLVETGETALPDYIANPPDRCFHCKNELFLKLLGVAEAEGYSTVLEGSNLDDEGDHRPGMRAAAQHGVLSPLRQAGLRKVDVRALARHWGLDVADKPAMPCLASRFPYGTQVTLTGLDRVGRAERWLRSRFDLRDVRVRHHEQVARIEASPERMADLVAAGEEIQRHLQELGYRWVSLDLGGFRSGSLNSVLASDGPIVLSGPAGSAADEAAADEAAADEAAPTDEYAGRGA